MDLPDLVSFGTSLIPFLNSGMVIIIVDLILRRMGVEITSREFKRKPWESLGLALVLIVISNIIYLAVQEEFSVVPPLLFTLLLLVVYVVVVSILPTRRR